MLGGDGWMASEKKESKKVFIRGPVVIVIIVNLVLTLEHITCHSLHLWCGKHRFWNKMTVTF